MRIYDESATYNSGGSFLASELPVHHGEAGLGESGEAAHNHHHENEEGDRVQPSGNDGVALGLELHVDCGEEDVDKALLGLELGHGGKVSESLVDGAGRHCEGAVGRHGGVEGRGTDGDILVAENDIGILGSLFNESLPLLLTEDLDCIMALHVQLLHIDDLPTLLDLCLHISGFSGHFAGEKGRHSRTQVCLSGHVGAHSLAHGGTTENVG